ncbi:MAG: porin [Planctomycetales bacterium]|nr:porin [Planctomycetales bacterium]
MLCKSWRRCVSVLVLSMIVPLSATADEPGPSPTGSEVRGAELRVSTLSPEEVFDRLERAETRIAELEAAGGQRANSDSPIRQASLSVPSLGSLFVGHDPEIAIAREQAISTAAVTEPGKSEAPKPKKWYDKLSLKGYAQFRFNEDTVMDDRSAPAQHAGDRSIGDSQSFLIRRARLIFSGDVHERVYVYMQTDFASTVPGSTDNNHYGQIRDWYSDFYLDDCKEFRLRIGQSKVPYGWENLQSSSNRIPFDRNDAFNSATKNERDLGVFYYWTPVWAQDFFKDVLEKGLKGTGNYGIFGLGVYNGQGGSLLEQNDNLHLVSRLTLPFELECGQYMEVGVQGYYGEYSVLSSAIKPLGVGPAAGVRPAGTVETGELGGWKDERIGASFAWYPQPLGFQTEWTLGRGPALNAAQTAIEETSLYGGYAMLHYKIDQRGTWFPFVRYSYYKGGYKSERNAPYSRIDEWELGTEWQINPAAELTLSYLITDRTNTTAVNTTGVTPYQQLDGQVVRLQFQVNY